jgi:hypothetical protein
MELLNSFVEYTGSWRFKVLFFASLNSVLLLFCGLIWQGCWTRESCQVIDIAAIGFHR